MAKYISSYTGAQIDANLALAATAIQPGDYDPEAKTSDMTQEVGKDANGKLWTAPYAEEWDTLVDVTTTEDVTELVAPCTYAQIFGNTNDFMFYLEVPAQTSLSSNPALNISGTFNNSGTYPSYYVLLGGSATYSFIIKGYKAHYMFVYKHVYDRVWSWIRTNNNFNSAFYSQPAYGSTSATWANMESMTHVKLTIGSVVPAGTVFKVVKKRG